MQKAYAVHAGKNALEDYWRHRGINVVIEHVAAGHFVTHFPLPDSTAENIHNRSHT